MTLTLHPCLVVIPDQWIQRAVTRDDDSWQSGPPQASAVATWDIHAHAGRWIRGMYCGASLPVALHAALLGLPRADAEATAETYDNLRPCLLWLTADACVALSAAPSGKLPLDLVPERVVVEPLTGWITGGASLADRYGEPDVADRLGVIFVGHATRLDDGGDESNAAAYSAAATMTAVCTGRVDAAPLLNATDAETARLFFGTLLFRCVGLTQATGNDRVSPDDFPRWVVGVPAFLRDNAERLAAVDRAAECPADIGGVVSADPDELPTIS